MIKASKMIEMIRTNLKKIIDLLQAGQITCLPTDTLFALACDATNQEAVNNIFRIKARDSAKPLPILCASLEQAQQYGIFSTQALQLAQFFWPGQLTLIIPIRTPNSLAITQSESYTTQQFLSKKAKDNFLSTSIAIRVPKQKQLLDIINKLGKPLIGTSANLTGHNNLHSISEITKQLQNQKIQDEKLSSKQQIYYSEELMQVIDNNLPSTIVDTRDRIAVVRHGYIAAKDITQVLDS